jgi:ribosomal protein L25 (general stress protein Ctc)
MLTIRHGTFIHTVAVAGTLDATRFIYYRAVIFCLLSVSLHPVLTLTMNLLACLGRSLVEQHAAAASRRQWRQRRVLIPVLRCQSSNSNNLATGLRVDPTRLVDGATLQRIQDNPALGEYLRANFPGAFDEGGMSSTPELESSLVGGNNSDVAGMDKSGKTSTTPALYPATQQEEGAFPLNVRPLVTYPRDPDWEEGSRSCRRLRWQDGMIPGLIYGSDPRLGVYSHQPESKIFVKTPSHDLQRELDRYGHHFESRVYELSVLDPGGSSEVMSTHRVVPRDLQRHPVHASVLYCVNFCRYHPGRPLMLPVTYLNEEESPALKRDGFILPLKRYIECFVEAGAPIPERLELECTGLRFKDVIRKDRIVLPDGVRFSDRVNKRGREYIIGVVFGKSRGAAAAASDDDAAGAEATAKA